MIIRLGVMHWYSKKVQLHAFIFTGKFLLCEHSALFVDCFSNGIMCACMWPRISCRETEVFVPVFMLLPALLQDCIFSEVWSKARVDYSKRAIIVVFKACVLFFLNSAGFRKLYFGTHPYFATTRWFRKIFLLLLCLHSS